MEEDPRSVDAIVLVWGIDICEYYVLYEVTQKQRAYFEQAMLGGAGSKENALANIVLGTALPERANRKDRDYADALKNCVRRTNKRMVASSTSETSGTIRRGDSYQKFYAITAL